MPVALQPFTLTCTVEIPPILKDLMNKSYKWYRNGQLLHNETKSTLTFESVMLMVDDKASYTCAFMGMSLFLTNPLNKSSTPYIVNITSKYG